jgi:AbrB family looped-hinge helix DNA binding protein
MSVILAIYGFIDLILLLAANVVNERVQPMLYALASAKKCERVLQAENETEGTGQKEKSNMRRTKINGKGQITIPADLRERFGIRKGTRIDWTRDGGRLVLTPINLPRKKSKVSTQST